MSGEVMGCQQIDITIHRWYVVIRITLEDGTDAYRVYAATANGIEEYESEEEFQKDNW